MSTRTTLSAVDAPVGYQQPTVPWNGLTVTELFCGAGGSSEYLPLIRWRIEKGIQPVMDIWGGDAA